MAQSAGELLKGTWQMTTKDNKLGRKTVMAELPDLGLSWDEAQDAAKDMTLYRNIVVIAL